MNKSGEMVELSGWIAVRRDHGKLIFVDLRDRSGMAQVVFTPKVEKAYEEASRVRPEWVVRIKGVVQARPEEMANESSPTGRFEVKAEEIEVLSEAETPPFDPMKDTREVGEETRLEYRYVDLRSERMQKNIRLRSEFVKRCREYLFKKDFTEIETPALAKSTPEGSRDFVVPSRKYPGKFYALPQSPQQYKQLLMASGFENYFQIARAFRDEDPRADRGYEHTQVDIETSFVDRDQVMELVEGMVIETVEGMGYKVKEKPFPRITYKESMEKYGADKFDLRTEAEKEEGVLAYAWVVDFPFFEKDDQGKWTFTHNPFSMPKVEDIEKLMAGEDIESITTTQYDLVCNGYESGGGSIRAHKPEILRATYKVMGYSEAQIEESVGHMLKAFKYGVPPHGGIALGVERNIMNLTGESYIREVQAFPMTGKGRTAVMDAPSDLPKEQLDELGIEVKKEK